MGLTSKRIWDLAEIELDLHIMVVNIVFTGDNGFYADRKFKMVDSEGKNCFENL